MLGIADLAAKVRKCYFSVPKEKRSPGLRITVSASVFVPKSHTPFQWAAQLDKETVQRRQKMLKAEISKLKGVDFKYHESDVSYIEAVFALRRPCPVRGGARARVGARVRVRRLDGILRQ